MKSVSVFFLIFWTLVLGFSLNLGCGQLHWQIICQIVRNISHICGAGIFIPIKHIQPGEEKILEERYLKEKDPKKGGKGGKEKSGTVHPS